MHRPLETTLWMRLTQFVKGVFLYNTIYWKRASDDLNIQRMTREERASLRPKRNLDIIRPRDNPRPTTSEPVPSTPTVGEVNEPARPAPVPAQTIRRPVVASEESGVEIHRRKKRRRGRHSQVLPKEYYQSTHEGSGGILGWLFKK